MNTCEYTCECCGGTFETTPEDERTALAEAFSDYGTVDASKDPNMAVVCHDCYVKITEFVKENPP